MHGPHTTAIRASDIANALPDALTTSGCLVAWVVPFVFGPETIKAIVLTLLLEFLLIHSTAFLMNALYDSSRSPASRVMSFGAVGLGYLLLVAAFALLFGAWWPILAFAWLSAAKLPWILAPRNGRELEQERQRQRDYWAFSLGTYIIAVLAGVMLPLPALGLNPEVVASLDLPGKGIWVEHPQSAVVSMALYYAASAWFKWHGSELPALQGLLRKR